MTVQHTHGTALACEAEPRALALACAVHDCDLNEVARITRDLDRDQLVALAVVAAAMVDIDRPHSDLLAWLEPDVEWTVLRLREAHALYVRGQRDAWARAGEREYQRQRHLRRTGRAA